MLLAIPSLADFYRKAFGLQEDGTLNEDVDPVAPSRLISFLVGMPLLLCLLLHNSIQLRKWSICFGKMFS